MFALRIWIISSMIGFSVVHHSFADDLPQNTPVPGGIAVLPIQSPNQPMVYFHEKRVPVLADPNNPQQWIAIVGLPLTIAPGEQQVTLTNPVRQQQSFIITPLPQILPTPDPSPSDHAQAIQAEQQQILATASPYSATDPFAQPFMPPLRGIVRHKFGDVVEGLPQLHVTIAAPTGTPIIAPTNAVVLAIKPLPGSGKTVFLDHGQGVITVYSPLTQLRVTSGQYIAQGKPMGQLSGSPGAIMGTLIWHGVINQALINPQLLLDPETEIYPCDE